MDNKLIFFLFFFMVNIIFGKENSIHKNYPVEVNYPKNSLMKVYEYRKDLFEKDLVDTEYEVYKQLSRCPLYKSVNYLVVPWYQLLKNKQLWDSSIKNNILEDFFQITIDGGFTVCQHIKYKSIIPILQKIGIDTLFTPHALKNEQYGRLKVLPLPHRAMNGIEPQKKDILYSFIGYSSHKVRKKLFEMRCLENCIIKERKKWHFHLNSGLKEVQKLEQQKYQNVLSRSRYSLCPRGTGPSTLRFWESLQAGSIPILISDAMSLPDGVKWDDFILRVRESDISLINDLVLSIPIEQEERMRKNCIKVFKQFSGENFASVIRNKYDGHMYR